KSKEIHLWNRGKHVLGIQGKYQMDKEVHKKSDFQWTAEAEAAFKEMKKLIAALQTLTAPREKEELIVYLAAAREVVSAMLMTEREAKQMPVC
ncbi:reverse transcriptase domain-containing protein, partial [Tanacetum coccineum]